MQVGSEGVLPKQLYPAERDNIVRRAKYKIHERYRVLNETFVVQDRICHDPHACKDDDGEALSMSCPHYHIYVTAHAIAEKPSLNGVVT